MKKLHELDPLHRLQQELNPLYIKEFQELMEFSRVQPQTTKVLEDAEKLKRDFATFRAEKIMEINSNFEKKGYAFFQNIDDLIGVKRYHVENSVFFGKKNEIVLSLMDNRILVNEAELKSQEFIQNNYLMVGKGHLEILLNYLTKGM
jgi:hypothetical protein